MPLDAVRSIRLVALVAIFCATRATADDAPAAPPTVRLWFRDGTARNAVLVAQASTTDAPPSPTLRFRTATGEISFSVESLLSVSDVVDRPAADDASALFRIERGPPRRLKFGGGMENVLIENPDGTREVVSLRKIARLQVVRRTAVARIDPG